MPIFSDPSGDRQIDEAYLASVAKPTQDEVGADIETYGHIPVTPETATQDPFTEKGALANALDEITEPSEADELPEALRHSQTYNHLPKFQETNTAEPTGDIEGVSPDTKMGEDKAVSVKDALSTAFDETFAMDGNNRDEPTDDEEKANEEWMKKSNAAPHLPDELKDEDKPDGNGLVYITRIFTVDPTKYISPNYRPTPAAQQPKMVKRNTVGGDKIVVEDEVEMEDLGTPEAKWSAKSGDEPTEQDEKRAAKEADSQMGKGNSSPKDKKAEDAAPESIVLDYATYIDGSSFCCMDEVDGIDYSKIAMDAGPKKKVTRENCQTTFAQCRAKNPLFCRFHGPKLLEADIRTALKAQLGPGTFVSVTKDKGAKDKFTFRLTVGCVPATKAKVEQVIHQFMTTNPGIKAKDGKDALQDVGKGKGSMEFEMDILKADEPPNKKDTKAQWVINHLPEKTKVVGQTPTWIEKAANGGVVPPAAPSEEEEQAGGETTPAEPPMPPEQAEEAAQTPVEEKPTTPVPPETTETSPKGLAEKDFHNAAIDIANAGGDIYDDAYSMLGALINGKVQGFGTMSAEDIIKDTATDYIDRLSQYGDKHKAMIEALQGILANLPTEKETPEEAEPPAAEEGDNSSQTEQPDEETDEPEPQTEEESMLSEDLQGQIKDLLSQYGNEMMPDWVKSLSEVDGKIYASLLKDALDYGDIEPLLDFEDSRKEKYKEKKELAAKQKALDEKKKAAAEASKAAAKEMSLDEKKAWLKNFKHGQKCVLKGADPKQQITFLKDNGDGTAEVQVKTPGPTEYHPSKVEKKTVEAADLLSNGIQQFGGLDSGPDYTDEDIDEVAAKISAKMGYPADGIAADLKDRLAGKGALKKPVLNLLSQFLPKDSPVLAAAKKAYEETGWKAEGEELNAKVGDLYKEIKDKGLGDMLYGNVGIKLTKSVEKVSNALATIAEADKELKALAAKVGEKAAMKTLKHKLLADAKAKALGEYEKSLKEVQTAYDAAVKEKENFEAEKTKMTKETAKAKVNAAIQKYAKALTGIGIESEDSPEEGIAKMWEDFNKEGMEDLSQEEFEKTVDVGKIHGLFMDAKNDLSDFDDAMADYTEKINSAEDLAGAKAAEEAAGEAEKYAEGAQLVLSNYKAAIEGAKQKVKEAVKVKKQAERLAKQKEMEKNDLLKQWNNEYLSAVGSVYPPPKEYTAVNDDFFAAYKAGDTDKMKKMFTALKTIISVGGKPAEKPAGRSSHSSSQKSTSPATPAKPTYTKEDLAKMTPVEKAKTAVQLLEWQLSQNPNDTAKQEKLKKFKATLAKLEKMNK